MLPTTCPHYSTSLSPRLTLSLNWGKLVLEPLFGTQMMGGLAQPYWDSFPNSKHFKLSRLLKPDQNDKTGPEIQLTAAHTTSLTKELYLIFVAVEQASTFKPYKQVAASPLPLRSAKIPQLFAVFFADRKKYR